jgi:hypothetical protein
MRRSPFQNGMRLLALLIVVSLLADLHLKDATDLQQIMWSCYWGAIAVASGLLLASERLVAWGTVFFAGLGVPAWILGQFLDFHLEVTSVLIHILPFLAGLLYLRRTSALPAHTFLGAWSLYLVPFLLSWSFTSPAEMINLSHWHRSAMPSLPFNVWQFYGLLMPLTLFTILLADRLINRWLTRRASARLRLIRAAGD